MKTNRNLRAVPAQPAVNIKMTPREVQAKATQDQIDLQARAERNWPGNENYQRQWVTCIQYLRSPNTRRRESGWVLDGAKVNWQASAV